MYREILTVDLRVVPHKKIIENHFSNQYIFLCIFISFFSGKPACEFPGEPAHGHVIPTKFHYDIGEMVTVECVPGFRVLGSPKLRCTSTGHWSSPLAHCRRIPQQS